LLGSPNEVHLLGDQVAFVYGKHKLIVMQSEGTFFTKQVGSGTRVDHTQVNGSDALWITGAEHFFGYVEVPGQDARFAPVYLAGNVLVWESDRLTLRLEGKVSKAQALRIARSFR